MKRFALLVTLVTIAGGILAAPLALSVLAAGHGALAAAHNLPTPHRNKGLTKVELRPVETSGPSCANPTPDEVEKCKELEQHILASTVRIEWNLWVKDNSDGKYSCVDRISHATVKQGRYLVTHNHSEVLQSDAKNEQFNRVSVFTSDGIPIWPKGPIDTLIITVEDEETLVLDFGDYGGQGLFATWGIPSSEFKPWDSLSLQPGMEVAQVVWNGTTAYVDWVTTNDVVTERGTPRLELDNPVALSASGAGVFWNGHNIANNWYPSNGIYRRQSGSSASIQRGSLELTADCGATEVAAGAK
jgi:hypothetical protein